MSGRTWERLEDLFQQAHALPDGARARFLTRACAGDEALRAEVEAMLAAFQDGRALLIERFVHDEHDDRERREPEDAWLGQTLGPWRLTRIIGRGGMGLVYGAARADGHYQLDVAIKLLRTGPRDREALDRFRTERHVLAALEHPNIARLLDGGIAADGTPYLVMELVDGVPLTKWCADQGLSLDERLRLFRVACDAVQHAHRALVVHRDLKPTNIFVTRSGVVKLLDFGIAKLLEPEAWGLTSTDTRVELRVLTPDYAAPEQRHGGAITTGTDVYALGVVLYELIAGVRPSDAKTLVPPSAVVGHDRKLARRVRGDLDRIVLTALRDEPERRYASAGQLGEEIGRFLDGRAVLAQPDTVGYRVRKFVGRNRLGVTLAALFVVSLATFGSVSAWQARVLAEQRRAAQLAQGTSDQVVRVLIDLFETTNPSVRPYGDRMPLGEFLSHAQARALDDLRDAPAVRAKLLQVFGLIHYTRGQYAPARQALEDALAAQRRLAGPDHPDALDTVQVLGELAYGEGDRARARTLLEESLDRHRRAYGDNDPRTARVLHALAPVVAIEDLNKAGELLTRALAIRRAAQPVDGRAIAESLAALGAWHARRGEFETARDWYRQALAAVPSPRDRRNPTTISILNDFASLLGQVNAHDEAENLQRDAIAIGREVLGADSLTVANLLNNLGTTQASVGRHADAEASFRTAFDTHRALLGDDHWRTRNVARNVGRTLALQQRYADALTWMDRAIDDSSPIDATRVGAGWGMRAQRAAVRFRLGRRDDALTEARAAVTALERAATTGDAASTLATVRVLLARLLIEAGRPQDAEPVLLAAIDWLQRLPRDHPRVAEASCELARARLVQDRHAADERARLGECLPIYRAWGLAEREVVAALDRLR